ncbi:MAG TPA: molybdopterin-synthase adenylyltransferase MoeB [Pseudomonadales bacterium]|nr:molybdopterin-synthase adenylyltransferase MoeB [Pseudomonadales bacterium]
MDDQQLLRYSRQIMLPDFEIAGQERLLASRVLIVGLGGLGSAAALYLTAAGVGELRLADHDRVDLSNLQRQILHQNSDLGRPKVASAVDRLRALNPGVRLMPIEQRLAADNLADWIDGVDLLLDCSDNFAIRFALNRASVAARIPLVSAAAIGYDGQLGSFDPRQSDSPCYHCLYRDNGEDEAQGCARNGVLAPTVGVIGTLQAFEAIKLLTGIGETLVGKLMLFDGRKMAWRTLRLPKDVACPVCASAPHFAG